MLIFNLSKRERVILFLCIGVIALGLFYNFILEPLVKSWVELNREIEIMTLKLRKADQILKKRLQIMEQYKNISSFIKPGEIGSDEEEIASLLSELEKLASLSNVRITDIKPRPAKELGYYKRYMVEVESEADISQLTKFIYEIQNSPQLLKVEKLSLNMSSASGNLLKATMIIIKILP